MLFILSNPYTEIETRLSLEDTKRLLNMVKDFPASCLNDLLSRKRVKIENAFLYLQEAADEKN